MSLGKVYEPMTSVLKPFESQGARWYSVCIATRLADGSMASTKAIVLKIYMLFVTTWNSAVKTGARLHG
jgi:hypothetical protein